MLREILLMQLRVHSSHGSSLLYLFPNYSLLPTYPKALHLKHHSKGTMHGKGWNFKSLPFFLVCKMWPVATPKQMGHLQSSLRPHVLTVVGAWTLSSCVPVDYRLIENASNKSKLKWCYNDRLQRGLECLWRTGGIKWVCVNVCERQLFVHRERRCACIPASKR